MDQLLAHLVGDYIFQTEWMANNKRKKLLVAFLHASTYILPFLLLTSSTFALFVMWVTHALIDYTGAARYIVFVKNKITTPRMRWSECNNTGFPPNTPAWLAVWLLIIVDNTLHLIINYYALRYL